MFSKWSSYHKKGTDSHCGGRLWTWHTTVYFSTVHCRTALKPTMHCATALTKGHLHHRPTSCEMLYCCVQVMFGYGIVVGVQFSARKWYKHIKFVLKMTRF